MTPNLPPKDSFVHRSIVMGNVFPWVTTFPSLSSVGGTNRNEYTRYIEGSREISFVKGFPITKPMLNVSGPIVISLVGSIDSEMTTLGFFF